MSGRKKRRTAPLLAIDTSTDLAGVALYDGTGLLAETTWHAGRSQTTTLLPEITRLLELSKLQPTELGALAVATGPGSFNGLRVGLSTAKGLSFALGVPLLGIPTLDAVAHPYGAQAAPVRALIAAGRSRYVSAVYGWPHGTLQRLGEYSNTTLELLATLVTTPTLLCGEFPLEEREHWQTLAPAALFPAASPAPRVVALAELAWQRWHRGESDDPATLEPYYLHAVATEQ